MRWDEEPDSGPTRLKAVIIQFKLTRRFFFPFFFGEISKLITGSLPLLSELKQIVLFISEVSDLKDCSTDLLVRTTDGTKASKAWSVFITCIFYLPFHSHASLCLHENDLERRDDDFSAWLDLYGTNVPTNHFYTLTLTWSSQQEKGLTKT